MNIETKTKEIEATYYWDAEVYDVQMPYFGDEVIIEYEDEGDKYWRLTFLLCGKVSYDTDALWENWRDYDVKGLRRPQLGYFAQDFELQPYLEDKRFVECDVHLSIMTMKIICRDIKIEHLNLSEAHFFWQDNEKKED